MNITVGDGTPSSGTGVGDKRCRRLLQLVEQSGRNIKVAIIPDQSAAFDGGMRTVGGLAGALDVLRRDFIVFFPRPLALLRPLEPRLNWCPFGAQYVLIGAKPIV
jgi:hypothetical protein